MFALYKLLCVTSTLLFTAEVLIKIFNAPGAETETLLKATSNGKVNIKSKELLQLLIFTANDARKKNKKKKHLLQ